MGKRMLWAGPYLQGTIPKQAVEDCTAQGRVDESIEYWVKATGFYVPNVDMAREYLVSTGRDADEIEAAEVDSITAQVFWDACHAVKNGDLFSLVG